MTRTLQVLRTNRLGLMLGGNFLSNTGSQLHLAVTSWLLFRLTGSSAMVGTLSVALQLPVVFLTIPAGVVVDHRDRRRFLAEQQLFQMTLAFGLAALVWTGHAPPWVLIAVTAGIGVGNAVGGPSWISYIGTLLRPDDMLLGYSLNSISYHSAAAIGPPLGALLLAAIGPGAAFAVNGLSFVAILAALAAMPRRAGSREAFPGVWRSVRDALVFARRSQRIVRLLPLSAAVTIVAFGLPSVLPAFASEVLGGGPKTYGALMGAFGAGSFAGAVGLGVLSSRVRRRTIMSGGIAVVAAGVCVLAWSRSPAAAAAGMFAVGAGQLSSMVTARTVIQMEAPPALAGRIVSLWFVAALGISPFGGVALGLATDAFGVFSAVRAAAVYAVAVALATIAFTRGGAGLRQPAGELAGGLSSPAR